MEVGLKGKDLGEHQPAAAALTETADDTFPTLTLKLQQEKNEQSANVLYREAIF